MKDNPRIVKRKCKFCGHNRAWSSRGGVGQYTYKCSRCGKID